MSDIGIESVWKSESIAKLSAALALAQASVTGAAKDALNPHFNRKYADLASVWDACRDALSKNGLAVVQLAESDGDRATVVTILTHSSGEWIKGSVTLRPSKADPQGIGSALTYGRRYGLAAMVGVAPEDDDGNAAGGPQPGKTPPTRAVADKPAPGKHRDRMMAAAKKWAKCNPEDVPGVCQRIAGIVGVVLSKSTTEDEFAKVADQLEYNIREEVPFQIMPPEGGDISDATTRKGKK